MIDGVPTGPYSLNNLQRFLRFHPDFDRQTLACYGEQKGWRPLKEYVLFDDYHDSLTVPSEQNNQIMLMINGQPCGPYTEAQVDQQLQAKEILLTNLISIDGGKSWCKLYEHPVLGHRKDLFPKELPFRPKGQLFFSERKGPLMFPFLFRKRSSLQESQEGLSRLIYLIRGKGFLRESSCEQKTGPPWTRPFARKGILIMGVAMTVIFFCFYKLNLEKFSLPYFQVKLKKITPSPVRSRSSVSRTPEAVPPPPPQFRPPKEQHSTSQTQGPRAPQGKDIDGDQTENLSNDFNENDDLSFIEEVDNGGGDGEEERLETIEGEEFVAEEN